MKISAVIITFNEQKNIERCINSLTNIADEIIVIDSFSTDNTKQICLQKNVTFVESKWQGYAATKNYGNSIAAHDYILSLDADEAISDDLKVAINMAKPNLSGAYEMNRLTNYCGHWIKHGSWYPDKKIRLFNRKTTQWKNLIVHEHIEFLQPENSTFLKGDILHYSFNTLAEHKSKIEKYALLEAQKVKHFSIQKLFFKILFSPITTFIKMYFLKLGCLDGIAGFNVARLSAYASYKRYSEAKKLK
jgi:(heptosyl)LPS beta-1,4-glucosyltransferase